MLSNNIKDNCFRHTCGCRCLEKSKSEDAEECVCEPLGICDNSKGAIFCHCGPLFSGSRCENCISGYTGWPYCRPHSICGDCLNGGICDYTTGKCVCSTNRAGEECDRCAHGYSGVRCLPEASLPLSEVEAIIFSIIFISVVCLCLAALIRWRIGCCGVLLNDFWRLFKFFVEGPDTDTDRLLKYKGCNRPNCFLRTPHSHGMRNIIEENQERNQLINA